MPVIPTETLLLVLIGLVVVLAGLVIHLEIRIWRLVSGGNGKSLEGTIMSLKKGLEEEQRFKKEMEGYLTEVERRLIRGVRAVEVIRFNAFQGTGSGGNQSFAAALINEKGDGVILSSLNARERVSIFAKPIKSWSSQFELSPEEIEALEKARQSIESVGASNK